MPGLTLSFSSDGQNHKLVMGLIMLRN